MPLSSPTILGNRLPINLPEPQKVGSSSWTQVKANNSFTVGIDSTNKLYAWGLNANYQVGDGTTLNKSTPVQLSTESFTVISAGFDHSVAITNENKLYTWGNQPSILSLTSLSSWTIISSSGNHNLAIDQNGRLFVWGLNNAGQLGDGTTINKSSPVLLGSSSWAAIKAGPSHSLAISSTGQLFVWGHNNAGQVGDSTTINKSSPVQITVSGTSSWSQVSAGNSYSSAIDSNGKLFAWGLNANYQLGDLTQINKSSPTQISVGTSWTNLSSGFDHSTAIDTVGNLYVWGNFNSAFAPIPTTINSWTKVSAGNNFTSAIRSDGGLYVWGINNLGMLGQNNTLNRSSPVQITAGSNSFTQISSNYSYLLAIDSLGKLFGVGENSNGQLGDNSSIRRSSSVQIGNSSWSLVNTGLNSSYGIDVNNKLYAWGLGNAGQIPTAVNTSIQWSEVASSESHNLAISSNGNLYAWGIGTNGELGLGDTITRSSPTLVDSGSWVFVHAAGTRSYAIRSDGRLYAWGQNTGGTLGDNTAVSKSSPVQVPGSWTAVATGTTHTVGIKSDGSVWSWGRNLAGQLGINSTGLPASSPVAVSMPVGVSATMVKVGADQTLVLTTTNTLYTWGKTNNGIGLNDTQDRSSPTQLGSNVWAFIAARANAGYGITIAGELYGWGLNTAGDLGDGTAITKSSPVLVTSIGGLASNSYAKIYATSGVSAPSAIAITKYGTLYAFGTYLGVTANRSIPTQVGTDSDWSKGSLGYGIAGIIKNNGYLYQFGLVYNTNTVSGTSFPVLIGYDARDVIGTNYSSPIQVGNNSWSQISSGTSFALGINSNNKLFAWGLNNLNQLGDGTTISQFSPVQIGNNSWISVAAGIDHALAVRSDNTLWTWGNGLAIGLVTEPQSWLSVNAGATHTLGIRNDGTLYAWGTNAQGQLGDLTAVAKSSPVLVSTQSWSSVCASNSFSLAIDNNNKLFAWGLNSSGQLGDSTSINKSSPTQISLSSFTFVSAGFDHTQAIDSTGKLYGWGQYTSGQTGVYDEIFSWSQLGYGIGLRANNTLYTWGLNSAGQVGDSTTIDKSSPVQIGTNEWASITLNYTTSSTKGAIKTNGTLYMWGSNNTGQLGLGDTINRSSPTQISGSWNQISTQQLHTAARNSSNIIYTWGNNATGELGDGTTINKSSPVLLASPFNTTSWLNVSVGFSYTTALRSDNIIYTWGTGNSGRLGTGLTTDRSNPVTLGGAFATSSFVAISAGALHALAIRSDNRLVAWGDASNAGQLGDGTTINKSTPVLVGTSSWTNVTANRLNNLGVTILGTLWFWGADLGSGESGLNATLNRSAPTQIGALTNWSMPMIVSAIDNTGRLFTWGGDNINLLDTTVKTSSPIQVGGFLFPPIKYYTPSQVGTSSWTTVSSGSSYSVGIATNNLLYGWGVNTSGQLGDTTTISKSSPVQLGAFSWNALSAGFDHVLAIRNDTTLWTWGNSTAISLLVQPFSWSQVSNGNSHSLAIRSDGALFTWGIGTSGQLGNNATISYSSPVQVGNSSWTSISGGNNFSLGIDINNRLYAWGLGTSGQLGLNIATSRSNPTQIDSSSYTLISAGDTHAFAITTDNKLFGWGTNNVGQLLPFGSYPLSGYSTFSIGSGIAAAIRNNNGALLTWGNNNIGQLGQGDTINRSNPTQIGVNSWKQVSAASSVVMAIRSDDTLWTWGLNSSGQLGDGSAINKSSPVQVAGSWSKISAGTTTSAGIRTDGTLWLWGVGVNGELGDGSNVTKSSPVQVSGGGSWNSVSVGNSFAIGTTTANIAYAWGLNTSGQLGDGTTVNKNVPTLLASPFNTTSFSQVAAGLSHSLGLTTTGLLYSWGGGSVGELGTGLVNRSNPTQVTGLPLLSTSYTLVYAGGQVSGAINQNNLYVWGINTNGILGTGDTINRSFPTQIGIGYSWTNIGIDNLNTLGSGFLRSDNSLWLTGNNSSGNLGNNTTINRSTPVQVNQVTSISAPIQIGTSSWTAISAGSSFSIGVNSLGQLYAWGTNSVNQIGNNSTVEGNDSFFQLSGSWTKVDAGVNHSLAIKSDSTLWTWGSTSAVLLSNVTPTSWTTIAAGGAASHVAAIKSDGTLWTWGLNINGQLGDGTTINKSSPTQIGLGSWSQVVVDISNTIAIRTGGNLFVWGGNSSGQLGDGTTVNRSTPYQLDNNSWSQIGINASHAAAIRNNLLFTWGNNATGQLGDNTSINKSSPVQVTGSWNIISLGSQYTVATNNSSLLFTWGNNAAFQLGDNTTINKSSPIQIASGTSFTSVSAGPTHAVAIDSTNKLWIWGQGPSVGIDVNSWTQLAFGNGFGLATRSDYKLFGWGRNDVGQLGLNDTINRSSPVLVSSGSWTAIAAAHGGNYASGITSDGKLFTWGQNSNGTLGDGTTINKSSPIQISVGSSFTLVSAGATALLAVTISPAFALFATGNAGNGALGDGTTINKSTPVQITNPSTSWTFISAGSGFAGAINNLGKLYMWGINSGYLGLGDTINRSTPTIMSGATSWLAISAGGTNSLAIDSTNKLWAWGWSNGGQLGDGTTINKSSPVQIGTSSWSQVATNDSTSMAIRSDNTVWTWGLNSSGQLGDATTINKSSPVQVTGNFSSIIISGNNSMAAIATGNLFKNKIFTWGNNTFNVLGLGNQINRSSPTLLFATTGTVIPTQMLSYQSFNQVSAGISYTLAKRTNDNVVMAWGLNTVGNYGDNTLTQPTLSNPVIVGQNNQVDNSINSFVPNTISGAPKIVDFSPFANTPYDTVTYGGSMQFSGNLDHISYATNALFTFGTGNFTVEFWLYGPYQLNSFLVDFRNGVNASYPMITTGVSTAALRYVGATGTLTGTVIIANNTWHHVAVTRESGTVKIWIDGVLDGTIADASNYSITSSVFFGVSSFLSPAFRLFGYLSNARIVKGQALYTTTFTPSTTPLTTTSQNAIESNVSLLVFQGFTTAYSSAVSAIGQTSAFIDSTNQVYITGLGASGQQGDGTTVNKSNVVQLGSVFTGLNTGTNVPIKVNDTLYSGISAGASFSVALSVDNILYAWGLNTSGQFGLNLATNRSAPTQIGALNQTFVDNSTFGYTLTYGGATQMVSLSPFASGSYDISIYGASQLFNGNPDFLELPFSTAGTTLQFGTGDFTIECWFNCVNVSGSGAKRILHYGQYTVEDGVTIDTASGNVRFLVMNASQTGQSFIGTAQAITSNTWYHVAIVKRSGVFYSYLNGTQVGTNSNYSSTVFDSTLGFRVGAGNTLSSTNAGYYFPGYISNVRVVKGVGVYTGNFTVPTLPLSSTQSSGTNINAITGTQTTLLTSKTINLINAPLYSKFTAGNAYTAVINQNDSLLYNWGLNTSGQLGINDAVTRSSPVLLGNNQMINTYTNSPVQVTPGTSGYTQVFAGQSFSMAKRTDDSLYAWGLNISGQLGLNTATSRSSPTQVGIPFSILDSSSNNFTITRVGTTYSTSVVPISGAVSGVFNGTTDYIRVAYNSVFNFGTNNLTLEAWVYPLSNTGDRAIIGQLQNNGSAAFGVALVYNSGLFRFQASPSSGGYFLNIASSAQSTNAWYHVAGTRNGNVWTLWVNGTQAATSTVSGTVTQDVTFGGIDIGSDFGNSIRRNFFNGYISNARVVNGVAVYTGTFTPPTSVLTATQSAGTNISAITGTETELLTYTTFAQTISEPSVTFTDISAGYTHTEAIAVDDKLYATGLGSSGQLGFGNNVTRSAMTIVGNGQVINTGGFSPVQVNFGLSNSWTNVYAGQSFSMAKDVAGSVYVWGVNDSGQIDNISTVNRSSPTIVGGSFQIADSSNFNAFITRTGTSYTTSVIPLSGAISGIFNGVADNLSIGSSTQLNLGTGDFTAELWLYSINTNTNQSAFRHGAYGQEAGFSIGTLSGTIRVGRTDVGSTLGTPIGVVAANNNTWYHVALVRISGLYYVYVNGTSIASGVGGNHNYPAAYGIKIGAGFAFNTTNPFYFFNGYVSNVRLVKGVGVYTGNFTVPTSVLTVTQSAGTNITAITGSQTSLLTYTTEVASVTGTIPTYFDSVAAGLTHVVSTYSDSTLYTWGLGTSGQLGDNTAVSKSSPVLIGNQFNTNTTSPIIAASASWTSTSAGTSHSLAIKNDGSLYAWGLNNVGQLGQSDTINRSSIVQIGSGIAPFIDSSSNAFTLTSNNNAFIATVSPFISGTYDVNVYGGSGSFNGSDQYVTTSSNTAFDLPGDFTLECWVYFNTGSIAVNRLIFDRWVTGVSGSYQLYFRGTGTSITFLVDSATILLQDPSPSRIVINTWYHIAIVRNGVGSNNMSMYINGTNVVSNTYTGNLTSSNTVYIGIQGTTLTNDFDGYISNLRLVKGTAVYTGNFTPATTPLTNISGTSLLTCLYSDFSNTYSLIVAGTSTSMAIKANNLLFAWGFNTTGQLGLNVAANRSAPVQVTTSSWSQVSTGLSTTLGINSDNNLYAWGLNTTGQLGASVVTPNRSSPTIVQGINYETKSPTLVDGNYNDASAGLSHTGVISTGALYMWGLNSSGQLGQNDTINRSSPVLVGAASSITDASSNNYTATIFGSISLTTAIMPFMDTTSLYFNGSSYLSYADAVNLQFGTGAFTIETFIYAPSVSGTQRVISKGSGGGTGYTLGITNTKFNFLINNVVYEHPTTLNTNTWYHIAVTRDISNDVRLFVNGISSGVLVNSTFNFNQAFPLLIGVGRGEIANRYTGYVSNLRLVKGTALYTSNFSVPTSILTAISGTQLLLATTVNNAAYQNIYLGSATTFGIRSDGNLFAWGIGTTGQINGFQQAINRSNPNQIGNNYISVSPSSPVLIAAGSWSKVAAGNSISAAIRSDGLLFTWGSLNTQGQLGDNTVIGKSSPVQIGNSSWTQVSIYFNHMAALTTTNGMYVWGLNDAGQIGDGTTINKSNPVQIGNSSWTTVSAGNSFTAGITSDNILFAWGFGTSGQLGYGTAANRSSPIQIGTSSWTFVTTGNSHASAIRNDGATFNWGLGTSGQLGRAYSSISRSSPVQVGLEYPTGDVYVPTKIDGILLSNSWVTVSSGASYTSAIKNNNTLYAWGLNNIGQLGENDTINRSSPSLVGTATYNDVSSGNSFTLGIAKIYPTSN